MFQQFNFNKMNITLPVLYRVRLHPLRVYEFQVCLPALNPLILSIFFICVAEALPTLVENNLEAATKKQVQVFTHRQENKQLKKQTNR